MYLKQYLLYILLYANIYQAYIYKMIITKKENLISDPAPY